MRTTIDLPRPVLNDAKRAAFEQGTTLSALVTDALNAHLQALRRGPLDQPFELIVRGRPGARFPTAEELETVIEEEDSAFLPKRRGRRHAPA